MILSISGTSRKMIPLCSKVYIGSTVFCIIFSMVYEQFSHGVVSNRMRYMFLIPLLAGSLPLSILHTQSIRLPGCFYHTAIATFTVGSCVGGILEIYGTTSPYLVWYYLVAITLMIYGMLACFMNNRREDSHTLQD